MLIILATSLLFNMLCIQFLGVRGWKLEAMQVKPIGVPITTAQFSIDLMSSI